MKYRIIKRTWNSLARRPPNDEKPDSYYITTWFYPQKLVKNIWGKWKWRYYYHWERSAGKCTLWFWKLEEAREYLREKPKTKIEEEIIEYDAS